MELKEFNKIELKAFLSDGTCITIEKEADELDFDEFGHLSAVLSLFERFLYNLTFACEERHLELVDDEERYDKYGMLKIRKG